jgi:hypothetical protein
MPTMGNEGDAVPSRLAMVRAARAADGAGTEEATHPIDDEELSAHVLARLAGEEDNRTREVLRVTPSPCRNALRDLTQANRVREELFVPFEA